MRSIFLATLFLLIATTSIAFTGTLVPVYPTLKISIFGTVGKSTQKPGIPKMKHKYNAKMSFNTCV